MSRLDSDRRSPEPCKGSYRRDVGCEEAPAYRGGRQAGRGVGVTYRRDVGCEEAPAYRVVARQEAVLVSLSLPS